MNAHLRVLVEEVTTTIAMAGVVAKAAAELARSTGRIRTKTPFEGEKLVCLNYSSGGLCWAGLCKFVPEWEEGTKNPISLQAMDNAIQNLLQLKTIHVVLKDTIGSRSSVFTVPMLDRYREYGRRFIFNIKVNSCLVTQGLMKTILFNPS